MHNLHNEKNTAKLNKIDVYIFIFLNYFNLISCEYFLVNVYLQDSHRNKPGKSLLCSSFLNVSHLLHQLHGFCQNLCMFLAYIFKSYIFYFKRFIKYINIYIHKIYIKYKMKFYILILPGK